MAAFTIRGKNVEVTPALRDYVEKRVGKITKYFDNVGEIAVLLSVEGKHHKVEVTAPVARGVLLRGEEHSEDMYSSIDLVIEKLERQIRKQKTKLERRFRQGGFKAEAVETFAQPMPEDEDIYPVVKTKRFSLQPRADRVIGSRGKGLLHEGKFIFVQQSIFSYRGRSAKQR